jgi:hypothetical protein
MQRRSSMSYQGKHRSIVHRHLISVSKAKSPIFCHPAYGRSGVNTAAALIASASLLAVMAAPAGATTRQPAPSSRIVVASAARFVHVHDGRLTLDTRAAEDAGALTAGSYLVADLNRQLADPDTPSGIVLDAADAAAPQNMTIALLPGVMLTIGPNDIQLFLSKQAVTEVENAAGLGQGIASLVGAILALAGVPLGPQITAVVADSLGIADGLFKLCVAANGSSTFTVSLSALPSCSGLSQLA